MKQFIGIARDEDETDCIKVDAYSSVRELKDDFYEYYIEVDLTNPPISKQPKCLGKIKVS